MQWWQAAVWGLAGGLCVEALELYAHIRSRRRWNWRRPMPQGMVGFVVSVRVGVGGVVAAAMGHDGQVAGAVAAFGLGVAAPLVIEKLARLVPLNLDVQATLESPPGPAPAPTQQAASPSDGGGGNAP